MRCMTCDLVLAAEDNYCRRCGAPVRVVAVTPRDARPAVVHVGPSAGGVVTATARPLAAGAAAVVAGAVVRFAVRRMVRGLDGEGVRSRSAPTRALLAGEGRLPRGAIEVTEVYYRRIVRS